MNRSSGVLLTIAGSDPSGGAGIQADIKTAATIGVYAAAAITSLTVQNTRRVFSANPVDPELVSEQANKVISDLPVTHIKTGMLGNSAVAKAVGAILAAFQGIKICDPVLHASSGESLLDGSSVRDLKEHIISKATAITPNFNELAALAGRELYDIDDIRQAVERLFIRNPLLTAIVVKGGHRNEDAAEITDIFFLRDDGEIIETDSTRKRIVTGNTHGTGCTFASALASYHLLTGNWEESFRRAGEYLQNLLTLSQDIEMGQGPGPLHHHLRSW